MKKRIIMVLAVVAIAGFCGVGLSRRTSSVGIVESSVRLSSLFSKNEVTAFTVQPKPEDFGSKDAISDEPDSLECSEWGDAWPQIDPNTGEVTDNDEQVRVLKRVSENSSYMTPVDFTTERVDSEQQRGVVHFVYEDGTEATDDIEVYFYPDQCAEIEVPYVPGYYSVRPTVWDWNEFEVTIVYTEERPLCCAWDDPAFYELRQLVPGQY